MAKRKTGSDDQRLTITKINREDISSEQFVSLYVNDIQVQITPWDFRFVLGVLKGIPTLENPVMTVSTVGEVRVSPQLAKRFLAVLAGQLKKYEESIGAIPMPQPD